MKSIFFDLETTDLNPVGQILNFAFVLVDEDFQPIDSLTGEIKIDRLQLPSPYAILANRVDVLKHNQNPNILTEREAMLRIKKWVEEICEEEEVMLVGQNSAKFDVPFLRTSMIRNGINPYWNRNLIYGDMKHVSYALAVKNDEFRELMIDGIVERPFSLQNQTQKLGLLSGEQKHESLDDVRLTIMLAEKLAKEYDADVRTMQTYEAGGTREKPGTICVKIFVDFKDPKTLLVNPMAYLTGNKKYAIWVDVEKFEEDPSKENCCQWFNKGASTFVVLEKDGVFEDHHVAHNISKQLSHVTLDNYFPPKTCDVEQHIYMLEFPELDALGLAIDRNDISKLRSLQSKHGSVLYLRHKLREHDGSFSPKFIDKFKRYALYRYGGQLKLEKWNPDSVYEPGVYNKDFHPTYNELIDEIDLLLVQKADEPEDVFLLNSLREFYQQSDIVKFAGDELKKIHREKLDEEDNE